MIVHDIALQNLQVLFCLDRGGIVGPDGPTHHGVFDFSFLRSIPGMAISAPKNGNELRDLMYTGLNLWNGPFAIRYPKTSSILFDDSKEPKGLEIGTWEILKKGTEIAILAVGSMVEESQNAIEKFNINGITPQLVNARFVKPLDEKMLDEISQNFSFVITVEEGALEGGFGSAVLSYLNSRNYTGKVHRLGIPDEFVDHGERRSLLSDLGLTSRKISETISKIAELNSAF